MMLLNNRQQAEAHAGNLGVTGSGAEDPTARRRLPRSMRLWQPQQQQQQVPPAPAALVPSASMLQPLLLQPVVPPPPPAGNPLHVARPLPPSYHPLQQQQQQQEQQRHQEHQGQRRLPPALAMGLNPLASLQALQQGLACGLTPVLALAQAFQRSGGLPAVAVPPLPRPPAGTSGLTVPSFGGGYGAGSGGGGGGGASAEEEARALRALWGSIQTADCSEEAEPPEVGCGRQC